MMLTFFIKSRLLATMLAFLATEEIVAAQDDEESLERSMERLDHAGPLPDRPVLIGSLLIWDDHALAGLCSELRGNFRKLAGRGEYMCRLPALVSNAAAITPKSTN